MPTRSQLSLFVPPDAAVDLEAVRRVVDPVQHRLIPAHVTLCREDELTGLGLADIRARLRRSLQGRLTLSFGPPERFGGHGILLPCVGGAAEFQRLRECVLAAPLVRPHAPHLTLAHPRNPQAPGNDLERIAHLRAGLRIVFDTIHCIDQIDGAPWVVRGSIPMPVPPADAAPGEAP